MSPPSSTTHDSRNAGNIEQRKNPAGEDLFIYSPLSRKLGDNSLAVRRARLLAIHIFRRIASTSRHRRRYETCISSTGSSARHRAEYRYARHSRAVIFPGLFHPRNFNSRQARIGTPPLRKNIQYHSPVRKVQFRFLSKRFRSARSDRDLTSHVTIPRVRERERETRNRSALSYRSP